MWRWAGGPAGGPCRDRPCRDRPWPHEAKLVALPPGLALHRVRVAAREEPFVFTQGRRSGDCWVYPGEHMSFAVLARLEEPGTRGSAGETLLLESNGVTGYGSLLHLCGVGNFFHLVREGLGGLLFLAQVNRTQPKLSLKIDSPAHASEIVRSCFQSAAILRTYWRKRLFLRPLAPSFCGCFAGAAPIR